MSALNSVVRKVGFAIVALAATTACTTTKPTPQETALVDNVARETLPATREERDAADRLDPLSQATFWGREHDRNPSDYEAALKFSRALRHIGSSARAAEVAGQALTFKPDDVELTLVFAQASLDQGQAEAAATALARAEAKGQSDWRMMSIVGVVMDALGQHADARDYYLKALALSPDNPKVLSNMGLSYALEGKPAEAEAVLREAAARPDADFRVRQNLIVVLGVQGKFEEAKAAGADELPSSLVSENLKYFQAMLTPARNWDALRTEQQ